MRVRVVLHQEATCCSNPLCTDMPICMQSACNLFFPAFFSPLNPKVSGEGRANIFQIPAPLLCFPPSFTQTPVATYFFLLFFCLSGKSWGGGGYFPGGDIGLSVRSIASVQGTSRVPLIIFWADCWHGPT